LFHLTAVSNVTRHLPQMESSRLALDQAMDRLNQAYGRNTVYFGGAQPEVAAGPARIAFTNIPAREVERKVFSTKPARRKILQNGE
jgi:DNA polymerase-4